MEGMARHQEEAYERLCRWVQVECRGLGPDSGAGDPVVETLQAACAALRERPVLYRYCAEEVAAARHNVKAESVVVGKKEARKRAQQERKTHLEQDMAAHDERHKSEILRRQAKGSAVSATQPSPCVLLASDAPVYLSPLRAGER